MAGWYRAKGHDLDRLEHKMAERFRKALRIPVAAICSKQDGVVAWQTTSWSYERTSAWSLHHGCWRSSPASWKRTEGAAPAPTLKPHARRAAAPTSPSTGRARYSGGTAPLRSTIIL